MAKVSIVTPDRARATPLPRGLSGIGRATAYFSGEKAPIHMYLHRIGAGERLTIGPRASDCLAYVWQGEVEAGGVRLAGGSSLIVEHGEVLAVLGLGGEAQVLTFAAAKPPANQRAGGRVHLLPVERVPRAEVLAGSQGVGGAMHSDGSCPTCEVWLHENHFAPGLTFDPEQAARGIHSHSEAEVIFVTRGAIRLGAKLFPAGTAVAIAADTLYSIAPGPDGMSFVNFRAGTPSDIRFASGMSVSETGYWQERLPKPQYLAPATA